MKVKGTLEVEISKEELGRALWQHIISSLDEDINDPGCDWCTDAEGNTYIDNEEWKVSSNPHIAHMVNTANYLFYGEIFVIDPRIRVVMQTPNGQVEETFVPSGDFLSATALVSFVERHNASSFTAYKGDQVLATMDIGKSK